MPRRYVCPLPALQDKGYFIELPDRWRGLQWMRYQEMKAKQDALGEAARADGKPIPVDFLNHVAYVSILKDWKLPGLNGNLDTPDYAAFDIQVVLGVNRTVETDFLAVFKSPESWLSPSLNGQAQVETTATALSPGNSETTS